MDPLPSSLCECCLSETSLADAFVPCVHRFLRPTWWIRSDSCDWFVTELHKTEPHKTCEHFIVSKLFRFEGIMKFTLAATPAGRERSRSAKKMAFPRVSDLTIEERPSPQKHLQRLPEEAPLEVAIYKVTDCAGDCWRIGKTYNYFFVCCGHVSYRLPTGSLGAVWTNERPALAGPAAPWSSS